MPSPVAIVPTPQPTQAKLFWFWLPLALSWLCMGLEGPILHGVISRLDAGQVQLAAFGVVLGLEILIEGPIIMLLATSTALASDGAAYRVLRRFMVYSNLLLTGVAAALAFTPLFDVVVRGWMGIPAAIADQVPAGLRIMTLWAALIGWRRFLQGLLIREGRTATVGLGTGVRLATTATTAVVLALLGDLSGVEVAAWALMAGVAAEALYAFAVSRPVVRRLVATPPDGAEVLTDRQVLRFHLPLAATSVLSLLVPPMISAGLARMPDPELTLAAWPVMVGVLMAVRSGSFALPETVIAQRRQGAARAPLDRFAGRLAVAALLVMLLLVATPLLDLYFRVALELAEELRPMVRVGLLWAVLLPAVHTLQNSTRGHLMAGRRTGRIYAGMGMHVSVVALGLVLGVVGAGNGVAVAVTSITAALCLEVVFLRRGLGPRVTAAPRPIPVATASDGPRSGAREGAAPSAGRASPG